MSRFSACNSLIKFTELLFFATLSSLLCPLVRADVVPNALFSDGVVLQQGIRIPIWGTASSEEKVSVSLLNQTISTKADRLGKWRVDFKPLRAGGPYPLSISGKNLIKLNQVFVGEVYLCGGQSNMEFPLAFSTGGEQAIKTSSDPLLHLFTVVHNVSSVPLASPTGQWTSANPKTSAKFSAVAYYFGRSLRKTLHVPIGLILASWGGTPAQSWTSEKSLSDDALLKSYLAKYVAAKELYAKEMTTYPGEREKYLKESEITRANNLPTPPSPKTPSNPSSNSHSPGVLYNAMIAPLIPFGIRGTIWYQGEANTGDAWLYQTLFPALIKNWRRDWRQGDFPFLFVQLAPYLKKTEAPSESSWAELREAQRLTSEQVNATGMAVITDLGDEKEIHPQDKEAVGERLALLARNLIYKQDVEVQGPSFESVQFKESKAEVSFKRIGGGLEAREGKTESIPIKGGMPELKGFTLAGEDGVFYNATAIISEEKVILSCPKVPKPVSVRYGWANYPVGNLWNRAGLPASPFRSDSLKLTTQP